jgi:hypothetical protein
MDYEVVCSICLEERELYYTECNHRYCITCLSKIHNCAICRSPLLRHKLCAEIKSKQKSLDIRPSIDRYPLGTLLSHEAIRFMSGLGGLAYSN